MERRGSITIFLSLTLLVLISFICTALQSVKLAGSRYLFLQAAESMVTSMHGAYDGELWKRYRVLALTDQGKAEEIREACKAAYEREEGLLRITLDSCRMGDQVTLADQGAYGWQQSVAAYMEYEIPVDLLSLLWEKTGIAEELSGLTDWYQDLRSIVKPVIELEEQIRELEERYIQVRDMLQSGKRLISQMERLIAQAGKWRLDWQEAQERTEISQGGGQDAPEDGNDVREREMLDTIRDILDSVQGCAGEMQKLVGEKGTCSSLLRQIQDSIPRAEALRTQLAQIFSEQRATEESPFLSLLSDFGGYGEKLAARLDCLAAMPEEVQKLIRAGERMEQLQVPSPEEILSGDGISQLSAWQEFLKDLEGVTAADLTEDLTEAAAEDQKSLMDFRNLREWLSDGILKILLPDGARISEQRISRIFSRSQRTGTEDLAQHAYENLLYGEYALRYTSRYGQDGGAGLQYETEYLIAGNPSDRENLTAVVLSLLGIRGAANLCYLLQEPGARSQTETAAAGISAALGGLLPAGVASAFLLTLWAAAEAVCDVRGLLQGNAVPLWKTEETWTLSWDQLWQLVGAGLPEGKKVPGDGMEYEEYLRILLYLTPLQEKCYRTMEAAEENLRASDSSLKLDEAIYQAVWDIQGTAAGQSCRVSLTYGY